MPIKQVTVYVAIVQLEVSGAHMEVTVSAANITIFVVIMQMRVSVAIMKVSFSAVPYAHDCFYGNYAG